ncbi:All-trans-phytoene synthase [Anatilimnocola aggregata]|uniref:All-trans-phytoene synthase n=1 Tax=Anatilimnocola aggregata TaxID=2528021 RepID=A0A517Y4P3_9BACT|nr:squalene synthase HpnC [Anatilimnocola aggregata]QDU25166.1 All-trans-phytoene synthase [Anatilimnocola aggregata]
MNLAEQLARWGPTSSHARPSLAEAEAYCRGLATSHYENFSVVSWLFPRHLHQHLCNVYAYCRWADDLADEAANPAQASELLSWWEAQLDLGSESRHPVFVALAQTIGQKQIPQQPFRDLLCAFRQEQVQTRYEAWADLARYCEHSANPVGRLVLHLGQSASPANIALSDSICTGLQHINFCQDVARDYAKGRIYLPRDQRETFGWTDERFAAQAASQIVPDDSFRHMLREQVERAEQLLRAGEPLVKQAGADLRLPIRLFIDGGLAIAQAIRDQRFDVWTRRPVVSKWTKLKLLVRGYFS